MNYLEALLNFQVFGDFSVIFLLLISSLIPLWWENTLCNLNSLNLLISFMAHNIVYHGINSWDLKECVFCYYWECFINVSHPVG